MKINFNQSFKDFKGNEIGVSIADEVGKLMFNLSTTGKNPMSADEKYMAYRICSKMCADGDAEISVDEAAFIVKVCGEYLTAGAYGQVKDLVEG